MTGRAKIGDVIRVGDVVPGNVVEVVDRCQRTWARDGAMFRYADAARSSVTLTDSVGPVTVTKISDEPETGEWVTVRPNDTRIKDGSRVRLGSVEGEARRGVSGIDAFDDDDGPSAVWCSRYEGGPDVELWVPAEPTLPLPTGPGLFWGRVERDHETYVGWVLYAPDGVWREIIPCHDYCTSVRVGGDLWHGPEHVTRLPVPDAELEALR